MESITRPQGMDKYARTKNSHPGSTREATFAPRYVHRAFGMNLTWARALESMRLPDGRRIPGSARRVLELLEGAAARNKGPVSQLGLVRLSTERSRRPGTGMPRSTIQDGLRALNQLGVLDHSSRGWSLKTQGKAVDAPPAEVRQQGSRGFTPTNTPDVPPSPQGGLAPERQAIAKELVAAGLGQGGALAAAKVTPLDLQTVQKLLCDLGTLHRAGRAHSIGGMAVWALRRGRSAARSIRRQARGIRGEPIAKTPTPDRATRMAHYLELRNRQVAVLRAEVAALTPVQFRLLAFQAKELLAEFPVERGPRIRAMAARSVWWDILVGRSRSLPVRP